MTGGEGLRMTGGEGLAMPPSVIARSTSDEAIPNWNPKLKALNPKQILISKFKTQNSFGHLDFGHLILFSISDLEFRIFTSSCFVIFVF